MSVNNNRQFEVQYGNRVSDEDFNILASLLQEKGIYLWDSYTVFDDEYYGWKSKTEQKIEMFVMLDHATIYKTEFQYKMNEFMECLTVWNTDRDLDITTGERTIETTTEEYTEVLGNYIIVEGTGSQFAWELSGNSTYQYIEEGVSVDIYLRNSYSGLELSFQICHVTPTVQRKETLEHKLSIVPLEFMGYVQNQVEEALKELAELRDIDLELENPTINCKYTINTYQSDECSPDIVKMTRNARLGELVEEQGAETFVCARSGETEHMDNGFLVPNLGMVSDDHMTKEDWEAWDKQNALHNPDSYPREELKKGGLE